MGEATQKKKKKIIYLQISMHNGKVRTIYH